MEKRLEIKLLEFLEPDGKNPKEKLISHFMAENFTKPDPLSEFTRNDNDDGVETLLDLLNKKFIKTDREAILQVNEWTYPVGSVLYKHWFDTRPHTAKITQLGLDYLYSYRVDKILVDTNKSTQKTNKSIRKNSSKQTFILWGTLVVAALSFLVSVINLVLSLPKKDTQNTQVLKSDSLNIPSAQTQSKQLSIASDTSFQTMAKKNLPKK